MPVGRADVAGEGVGRVGAGARLRGDGAAGATPMQRLQRRALRPRRVSCVAPPPKAAASAQPHRVGLRQRVEGAEGHAHPPGPRKGALCRGGRGAVARRPPASLRRRAAAPRVGACARRRPPPRALAQCICACMRPPGPSRGGTVPPAVRRAMSTLSAFRYRVCVLLILLAGFSPNLAASGPVSGHCYLFNVVEPDFMGRAGRRMGHAACRAGKRT